MRTRNECNTKGTREKSVGKVVGEVFPEHYRSSVPVDSQECCIMHISSWAPQGTESERKTHQYITVQTWHFCNWRHTREQYYWKHISTTFSIEGAIFHFVCDWLKKERKGELLSLSLAWLSKSSTRLVPSCLTILHDHIPQNTFLNIYNTFRQNVSKVFKPATKENKIILLNVFCLPLLLYSKRFLKQYHFLQTL